MVRFRSPAPRGRIPEWPKGADCKSVVDDFGGSNPPPPTRKTALFSAVFSWRRRMDSHPMLTRFFCLHELRMQIKCRKTAIPSKALLPSSAFLLTNPSPPTRKTALFSAVFSWRRRINSHPMLTRFFCLHELRMQIRCGKTAIPSKALLLSSAFLLTNPPPPTNKSPIRLSGWAFV